MPFVSAPSLQFLQTAVVVMALCNFVLGVGMFFLMQVRYSRNLAHGTRRISFANLIVSPWDGKNLEELWAASARDDREAIEEVLASDSQLVSDDEREPFQRFVTGRSIYANWIQHIRTGRSLERVRSAKMLGYFPDERGVQALADGLRDPSPKVALSCVLSLGRLEAPAAVPALMNSLSTLPKSIPDITLTAVLAGCARQTPSTLAELLKSPEDRIRILGAWAISEVADKTVLRELVNAAPDAHPEVRAKVARGLARIPDPASVEALITLARDPVWFVRLRALHSLGELRAPEGGEVALAALADEVREVRYRAAYALRKIQGMKSEVVLNILRTGSRSGFDSLISEWERAGFLDSIAREISEPEGTRASQSREFLRVLIGANITSTLENFVLFYPNPEVRWGLANLLLESPHPGVLDRLQALAKDPRCDARIARAILEIGLVD
ncbi:MAG: HEAT repeat domain-containing protein [Terriglobia bacterium]|jgi:HEAT repeat protein